MNGRIFGQFGMECGGELFALAYSNYPPAGFRKDLDFGTGSLHERCTYESHRYLLACEGTVTAETPQLPTVGITYSIDVHGGEGG